MECAGITPPVPRLLFSANKLEIGAPGWTSNMACNRQNAAVEGQLPAVHDLDLVVLRVFRFGPHHQRGPIPERFARRFAPAQHVRG